MTSELRDRIQTVKYTLTRRYKNEADALLSAHIVRMLESISEADREHERITGALS